jgi:type II restriction/modification system DNA methylase subunit YeeA
MLPTLTPQQFVAKWRHATLKERSAVQEHFIDLCRLVGHPTPAEADPKGEWFTFEAGASKLSGGQGWADVWKKGSFAWEYKGKHADLDKAYRQLLQYREALQNPPLLIVSDINRILIHTNFTNTVKRVYEITLDDLLTPEGYRRLHSVFYAPETLRAPQTTQQVTEAAAREFARLADLLRRWGEEPHPIAHFLIRLLFCLFAEDVGLLPGGLFSRLIEQTRTNSAAFTRQLKILFGEMAGGGWFGADEIPQFDGRLFDDGSVPELDSEGIDILARVSSLDWSNIEPSILGTLFERSLDPSKRAQIGAHYTSKEDILLIVEPVLMAPLRRRWAGVQEQARNLAARRDAAKSRSHRTRLQNELESLLAGFAGEIAQVQVLDPGCGSGNFLYIALKQLLDLQKEIATFASEMGMARLIPSASPAQLHGIEVNAYAHELAQATVWIGYIQWLQENGYGFPPPPILKPLETILQKDAILAYDEQGRPVEPEWPEADVVIGNPPFLGGKRLRTELSDPYVDSLFALYEGRVPHEVDLVCYWFERARALIESGELQRAGLLATQAIRGGANRKVLERIKQTGDIFWAQSDRDWILDGAAVHVSMVGFDDGSEISRALNGTSVGVINADLTSALNLTVAKRLPENAELSFMGDTKGGAFDLTPDVAAKMIHAPLNPNGCSNSDVLRPWINGSDVTQRSRGMWIIDFGVDMPESKAALYEAPFEYVLRHVKPKRLKNKRASYRERWWIHVEPRPAMRVAVSQLRRYIATPRVSKYRLFVWMSPNTLADSATIAIARDDDYFLGVLHSKVHELWARSMGTQLREAESGFRYTPTTTFETFPFPWPPSHEPKDDPRVEAIAQAARELVEKRDAWLNPPGASQAELKPRTLTNLYNERPTWLDLAHRKLDEAVLEAYGWPHDLSDEEILERLLALNLERAAGEE